MFAPPHGAPVWWQSHSVILTGILCSLKEWIVSKGHPQNPDPGFFDIAMLDSKMTKSVLHNIFEMNDIRWFLIHTFISDNWLPIEIIFDDTFEISGDSTPFSRLANDQYTNWQFWDWEHVSMDNSHVLVVLFKPLTWWECCTRRFRYLVTSKIGK